MVISKLSCGAAWVLAIAVISAVPGHAEVAKIGILSCDVSKGVGEILARKQSLTCQFKPDGGQTETYVGSIDEYGVEIGKVDQGHLIWGVASAMRGVPQGALAGKYVGVGAGGALGVGAAPPLSSAGTIALSRYSRSRSTARPASTSQPALSG